MIIGWVLFKCEDMSYGLSYLKAMFGGFGTGLWNQETIYLLCNYAVLFVIALFGSTMLPKRGAAVVLGNGRKKTWAENAVVLIFYGLIFVLSVAYLVDATYNPFLYFRF